MIHVAALAFIESIMWIVHGALFGVGLLIPAIMLVRMNEQRKQAADDTSEGRRS
jgi:hypothetical protein